MTDDGLQHIVTCLRSHCLWQVSYVGTSITARNCTLC